MVCLLRIGRTGASDCLDSDVVLAGFSAQNKSFLRVPADSFSRGVAGFVKSNDLRSLLSDFACFGQ